MLHLAIDGEGAAKAMNDILSHRKRKAVLTVGKDKDPGWMMLFAYEVMMQMLVKCFCCGRSWCIVSRFRFSLVVSGHARGFKKGL
jgi:hypothetical protein